MHSRAQGTLAFGIILATIFAGVFHLSWWAIMAGASALAMISIFNYPTAARQLGSFDGSRSGVLYLSSSLNASAISAAALMLGNTIGWAWGV